MHSFMKAAKKVEETVGQRLARARKTVKETLAAGKKVNVWLQAYAHDVASLQSKLVRLMPKQ